MWAASPYLYCPSLYIYFLYKIDNQLKSPAEWGRHKDLRVARYLGVLSGGATTYCFKGDSIAEATDRRRGRKWTRLTGKAALLRADGVNAGADEKQEGHQGAASQAHQRAHLQGFWKTNRGWIRIRHTDSVFEFHKTSRRPRRGSVFRRVCFLY